MTPALTQPQRVLVVAPQPFYEDRGTPIAVRHVLRALADLGYQVDVLTLPIGQTIPLPNVRYFRVPNPLRIRSVPIGFSWRKVWFDLFLAVALIGRLRRTRYHCIHAVEEAAFFAVVIGRWFRTPVVYDMQSSLAEQMWRKRLLRHRPGRLALKACEWWLVRRAHAVIASAGLAVRVRRYAPRTLVQEWHYPSQLPQPSPTEVARLRAALGLDPEQPVVVYTGNFEDYQGVSLLLKAIPGVWERHPRVTFVLVGAANGEAVRVAQRLRQEVPSEAFRIVPRQPMEVMGSYLGLATVAVSPRTYGSNLPLKVLDYLAAGRAIVATAIPAHLSVLNEETAVLVPPSGEAMASALAELLSRPERIAQLQQGAREFAGSRLAWLVFVQTVARVYDALPNGSPAAPGDQ